MPYMLLRTSSQLIHHHILKLPSLSFRKVAGSDARGDGVPTQEWDLEAS